MRRMTAPSGAEARAIYEKTLACVHCGLCLPACPAYENAPRESLAPRGQVFNARALLEGRLPASAGLAEDLYECLACRGCETVCPAGVEVGAIVEGVRGLLEEERVEPLPKRLLKRFALGAVVARPRVLGAVMAVIRLGERTGLRRLLRTFLAGLLPTLAERERLLPAVPPRARLPRRTRPDGGRRGVVALFVGCVAPHLRPETGRAAVEALARNGLGGDRSRRAGVLRRAPPPRRTSGPRARPRPPEPADLRRRHPGWSPPPPAAAPLSRNTGSCCAATNGRGVSRDGVADVAAFLVRNGFDPPAVGPRKEPLRVVYDAPCHLFHAQRVRDEPIRILESLPGVERLTVRDPERCCGSAGIYNITRHHTSMAVLDRKMAHIAPARPDLIATGNIGCQLQLAEGARRAGLAAEVAHPVELLARAYRRSRSAAESQPVEAAPPPHRRNAG